MKNYKKRPPLIFISSYIGKKVRIATGKGFISGILLDVSCDEILIKKTKIQFSHVLYWDAEGI